MKFTFIRAGWDMPQHLFGKIETHTAVTDKIISYNNTPKVLTVGIYLPPQYLIIEYGKKA